MWRRVSRLFGVIRKYTKNHEWVEYDPSSKVARIGITDFAQSELGDIIHVELPSKEAKFNPEASFATIETVKTAADIYTPFKVTLVRNNPAIEQDFTLINKKAEDIWLSEFRVDQQPALDELMTKEQYLQSLK
jgi:glycine cleavage system H protein